ncbi:MAG: spore germination protein [Bacilli bacterium]|nr:spore germination protein [Bacilli bacterium]
MKKRLVRSIPTIQSELSLCGPKDSFVESLDINIGLIKNRITSKNLKINSHHIGRYCDTSISVLYIDGIVKEDLIIHIMERLQKIDIDGIIDSSYLKQYLENHFHLFPTIIMSERPDMSCMSLLEGKAVILVDNSPYALILPNFFVDFFHTTDDYYQKPFNTSFIRFIRLFAFIISIFTPAFYICITTRNYHLIPFNLLLILKAGRSFVPFPAYLEAIFMIICFEILKESDLRMSTTSGSSISILGGLILGDAAVAAGIVSPIMIIVIAISSISGLIFTSFELENALRMYKIVFLILSSLFGLYGMIYGIFMMLYDLYDTKIFGYPYFSIKQLFMKDSFIRTSSNLLKRNPVLSNNFVRGRIQK